METSGLTALEPTPVTPVSFRCGFPVGGSHQRRGSAFDRSPSPTCERSEPRTHALKGLPYTSPGQARERATLGCGPKMMVGGVASYPGRRPRRPCPGLQLYRPSGAPERRSASCARTAGARCARGLRPSRKCSSVRRFENLRRDAATPKRVMCPAHSLSPSGTRAQDRPGTTKPIRARRSGS